MHKLKNLWKIFVQLVDMIKSNTSNVFVSGFADMRVIGQSLAEKRWVDLTGITNHLQQQSDCTWFLATWSLLKFNFEFQNKGWSFFTFTSLVLSLKAWDLWNILQQATVRRSRRLGFTFGDQCLHSRARWPWERMQVQHLHVWKKQFTLIPQFRVNQTSKIRDRKTKTVSRRC